MDYRRWRYDSTLAALAIGLPVLIGYFLIKYFFNYKHILVLFLLAIIIITISIFAYIIFKKDKDKK